MINGAIVLKVFKYVIIVLQTPYASGFAWNILLDRTGKVTRLIATMEETEICSNKKSNRIPYFTS